MSLLAIILPGRDPAIKLGASTAPAAARAASAAEAAPEWSFIYSRQGQTVDREGRARAQGLPKADRIVLVAPDEALSWLSVQLPPVASKRLKEALRGALEDQLLEDAGSTHLAVSKLGVQVQGPTWVAALNKPWIEQVLARLQEQGLQVDALVCTSEPGAQWQAHARLDAQGQAVAVVSGPQGVLIGPLTWPGWRTRLPQGRLAPSVQAVSAVHSVHSVPSGHEERDGHGGPESVSRPGPEAGPGHAPVSAGHALTWSAEPNAARALAEQGQAQARLWESGPRSLHAATTGTNLLQFDLVAQRRGTRALWAAWASFKDRRYRAVHLGLASLVLVQALGLNVWSWQAQREVQALQLRNAQSVREAFPSVQLVVEPVLQAERELQALRRAAGEPGPQDLETGLNLVARAWASQSVALQSLRWDAQGLSLVAAQWPTEAVRQLEAVASTMGWQTQMDAGVLRLMPPRAAQR